MRAVMSCAQTAVASMLPLLKTHVGVDVVQEHWRGFVRNADDEAGEMVRAFVVCVCFCVNSDSELCCGVVLQPRGSDSELCCGVVLQPRGSDSELCCSHAVLILSCVAATRF